MSRTFTIAGRDFDLDREKIEHAAARELPEPIQEHFVVVQGRRYPPKQLVAAATGLDRADFTTHHARRVLTRLGFPAARRANSVTVAAADPALPYGGRQAEALRPFIGKWVALGEPTEVLVAADTLEEVVAWLTQHDQRASGVFRVPLDPTKVQGAAPL